MKVLYLIDGTGLVYRAYFAIKDLTTSKGEPTNAIFGVMKMIIRFINDYVNKNESYCVVVFDLKTTTYRNIELKTYKANRPKPDDALLSQIEPIKEMFRAFGFKTFGFEGFEADDAISAFAAKFKDSFDKIYILTSDKDMMQLVDDKINILRLTHRGITDMECYDINKVKERFGVKPSQIADFLGLQGDASDNIPGVRGIGEKTAVSLLSKYRSVEEIYEKIDEIEGRKKDLLLNSRDMAFLSKRLATLQTNVDLSNIEIRSLRYTGWNEEKLYDFFKKYEFFSAVKELRLTSKISYQQPLKRHYLLINSKETFDELIAYLEKADIISFDTETTGRDPIKAKLIGVSLCVKPGTAYYIPLNHETSEKQLDMDEVLNALKPILEDRNIIGQNLKYDYIVMRKNGVHLRHLHFDTLLASYLVDAGRGGHYNLDTLSLKYLNYKMISYGELFGAEDKEKSFAKIGIERASDYSAEDADVVMKLYPILNAKIEELGMKELFYSIEMPLIEVLADMEMVGVRVEVDKLEELSKAYEKEMKRIEEEIYALVGEKFNINSSQQVSRILRDVLKLKMGRKTKTGAYSTSSDVLEALAGENNVARLILNYRKLAKLLSTYIRKLPIMINEETGKIHTSFNQTVTATGRLSSSNPNLQNIPMRNELGREIRKVFVPDSSYDYMLSSDYSQIELRILAHISSDENLIEAFKKDKDIHSITAARIYGVEEEFITSDMRKMGKMVNFATIYGVSAYGLSRRTGIKVSQAQSFIDNYFKSYPGVKRYIDETIEFVKRNGYVHTIFGRRRYILDIASKNHMKREAAIRAAINMPVQGSAADIFKVALIKLYQALISGGWKSRIILQVHDEIILECPEEELEDIKTLTKNAMESVIHLKVPLKVDLEWGKSWYQ
ncbi:MAG: DNA polymerase I [Thermotoga sp.]|nr:MAG: DNA polymerase I [Thermotoga sp.]